MKNKKNDISLPLNLISKYRAELMGFAILGVLWGHLMNETWQPVVFSQLARLIHTAGFIFLSGFGLYYAFQKSQNIKLFYQKRITRILLPFVVITYWFFIVAFIHGEESIMHFITDITTISFWIYGEAGSWAMWYVSATILLYLLFPLLYHFLFSNRSPILHLVSTTVLYAIILFAIVTFSPSYWANTRIFWARFIMFPLGMYAGYLSFKDRKASLLQISIYFFICVILALITKLWIDDELYAVTRTLIGIPLITIIVHILSKWQWLRVGILKPVQFLGIHSYELYLIHVIIYYLCRNIIGIGSAFSMMIGISVALLLCKPIHDGINILLQHKK